MMALIMVFVLGFTALLFVTIGMGRNDLAEIRTNRTIKKHPGARHLRARPVVYVIIDGHATKACLESIRKSRYKKLVVSRAEDVPPDALLLRITDTTQLQPNAILNAVQFLATNPNSHTKDITPYITLKPTTIRLLQVYATLANIPFSTARSGYNIAPPYGLSYNNHPARYSLRIRLFKIINLIAFIYACYSASVLNQPELILLYAFALSFWLVWSITRYPYYSFAKKLWLLALAPVSFVYFVYLAIAAPFQPARKQTLRQNAIIEA